MIFNGWNCPIDWSFLIPLRWWIELIWYRWWIQHLWWEDVDVPLMLLKNMIIIGVHIIIILESPSSSHFYGWNMLKVRTWNHGPVKDFGPSSQWYQYGTSMVIACYSPRCPSDHSELINWLSRVDQPTTRSTRSLEDCIGLYYSISGWGLDRS